MWVRQWGGGELTSLEYVEFIVGAVRGAHGHDGGEDGEVNLHPRSMLNLYCCVLLYFLSSSLPVLYSVSQ